MEGHGGHAAGASTTHAHSQSHQIETSVIKTMIIICAFYAVCYFLGYVVFLLLYLSPQSLPLDSSNLYFAAVFLEFGYMSINPFIYATKFDPVKQVLLRMIPCKKNT